MDEGVTPDVLSIDDDLFPLEDVIDYAEEIRYLTDLGYIIDEYEE